MQVKDERQATNRRSESLSVLTAFGGTWQHPGARATGRRHFPSTTNLCSICSSFSSAGKSCNCESCTLTN